MKYDPYNFAHFSVMVLASTGAMAGLLFWLLSKGYFVGDTMPEVFKAWGMAFVYVAAAWFLIIHRPKRPE